MANDSVKSRITAAIWPWGTRTREQMETAAAAVSPYSAVRSGGNSFRKCGQGA